MFFFAAVAVRARLVVHLLIKSSISRLISIAFVAVSVPAYSLQSTVRYSSARIEPVFFLPRVLLGLSFIQNMLL